MHNPPRGPAFKTLLRFPAAALLVAAPAVATDCTLGDGPTGESAMALAATGRVGAWDKDANKFLDPVLRPDGKSSYFAMQNGSQLNDFLLAKALFDDVDTRFTKYGAMQLIFDACHAGGFIPALGTTDNKESSLKDANKIRPNLGVMTSCTWDQCAAYADTKDGSGFFTYGAVKNAWDAPHPDDDAMLPGFKGGCNFVRKAPGGLKTQAPQYWSSSGAMDDLTFETSPDRQDYFFLVFNPAAKGKETEFALWNDAVLLHDLLVKDYKWSDDPGAKAELVIFYDDGTKPNFVAGQIGWIDGAASEFAVEKELKRVHEKTTQDSHVFFYFGGHGASQG
jgi:hypothetical protein